MRYLHLQAFELNPELPLDGEPIADYAARKYGVGADVLAERQALIRACGEQVGYEFGLRTRVYNTFDAHRLLHWAGIEGKALALKRELLLAYHCRGENPARHEVLLNAASVARLDVGGARRILAGDVYAADVRASVQRCELEGTDSVPSVIVDERQFIEGSQTADDFWLEPGHVLRCTFDAVGLGETRDASGMRCCRG